MRLPYKLLAEWLSLIIQVRVAGPLCGARQDFVARRNLAPTKNWLSGRQSFALKSLDNSGDFLSPKLVFPLRPNRQMTQSCRNINL
jgi:hypothetical protein